VPPSLTDKFDRKLQTQMNLFTDAFLTDPVNQLVLAGVGVPLGEGIQRKCWKQSKCPENNTS
jgi:hypothetical protein